MLDVVNQLTKELEKNKKEQEEPAPTVEISSSEENAVDQAAQKETVEEQMTENGENSKQRGEELCVALLEEILLNLESLKKIWERISLSFAKRCKATQTKHSAAWRPA